MASAQNGGSNQINVGASTSGASGAAFGDIRDNHDSKKNESLSSNESIEPDYFLPSVASDDSEDDYGLSSLSIKRADRADETDDFGDLGLDFLSIEQGSSMVNNNVIDNDEPNAPNAFECKCQFTKF